MRSWSRLCRKVREEEALLRKPETGMQGFVGLICEVESFLNLRREKERGAWTVETEMSLMVVFRLG